MGLYDTPSGERIHIAFFGMCNAGKSSVVNAVMGQELAVVSDVKGTTTDPVTKAMELLPLGPVQIIDTPGFDDQGVLGEKRVQKTKQILNKTDIAVLVVDAAIGNTEQDLELISLFQTKEIPYLIVYNKSDLLSDIPEAKEHGIYVSALQNKGITELKERLAGMSKQEQKKAIVGDRLQAGDFVLLVVPIDSAAPKGRLILPQQQTIRDILDTGAIAIVVRETELQHTLEKLGTLPALVITDSQVFDFVSKIVPREVPLTSFSILMARYKGLLYDAVRGVTAVQRLQDGDTVLIAEGCTHHRQCGDIGTEKIPNWLRKYTGKQIQIATCSGIQYPEDLTPYAMIIHCGGCMLNEREVRYRTKCAIDQEIPITNFGILIAYLNGILQRSVEIFPNLHEMM